MVARLDSLIRAQQYDVAEELALDALQANPTHVDLNALVAFIYLWTQRETDALPFALAGADSKFWPGALQQTFDALCCRAMMAEKLGASDPTGAQALEALSKEGMSLSDGLGIGISAILIVKNEEQHLGRCLKSLQGAVDQIVVVDTGSSDATVAIAEEYGAKIGHFVWCDDFAAARNKSIEMADEAWLLWIDADEELAPSSAAMLREAAMRPQFGGYTLRINNLQNGTEQGEVYQHWPLRLFRNDSRVRFEGRIHEQIVGGLLELGWPVATLSGVTLNHYGYSAEMLAERNKVERTLRLLEMSIEESPDFSFHWFNYANALAVAKRFQEVETAAKKAIDLMPEKANYERSTHDLLCGALLQQEKFEEVLECVDQSEKLGLHTIVLQYQRCEALRRLERLEEAISASNRCLQMEWPEGLSGDYSVFTLKRYLQAARIYGAANRFEEALTMTDIALEHAPRCATAHGLKAMALAGMGRVSEALASAQKAQDDPYEGESALQILVNFNMQLGDVTRANSYALQGFQRYQTAAWAQTVREVAAELGGLEAVQALGELLRDFPAGPTEVSQLAANWAAKGRISDGIQWITENLQLNPQSSVLWFTLGDLVYGLENWTMASECYQMGLTFEPDHAAGWFVLANALTQREEFDAAIRAYQRCLELDPQHEPATQNLEFARDAAGFAA